MGKISKQLIALLSLFPLILLLSIFLKYFFSDALPDDFGSNTNKKRLRQFPENIRSLVGGDFTTLLPRLPVLFRFVLRRQYIRDDIKTKLLQQESKLPTKIFVFIFT